MIPSVQGSAAKSARFFSFFFFFEKDYRSMHMAACFQHGKCYFGMAHARELMSAERDFFVKAPPTPSCKTWFQPGIWFLNGLYISLPSQF